MSAMSAASNAGSLEQRFEDWINSVAACPWQTHAGMHSVQSAPVAPEQRRRAAPARAPLYTPEERARRDHTPWTLVQGVLAPVQFLAFAVSLALVLRYLATGEGAQVATVSVIVKTGLLYTIMITGCVWEKVVFGKYLFAPAFFWEDVFSMLVLALHTAYLAAVLLGVGTPREQMLLALAAYAAYAVNAAQFIWKLRMARLEAPARGPAGAAA
jgi:3-vinyl bacteriochlorophyllide hydratase